MDVAISAVRVYVVSKGNRYLAVLVFALSMVQFAMGIVCPCSLYLPERWLTTEPLNCLSTPLLW